MYFNISKFLTAIFFISNLSFGQDDVYNAIKYDLKFNRTLVRAGETITLIADIELLKDYFIYSSNPDRSLSPSYIEWEDSSFFSVVGILKEPKVKMKYDPNFIRI